MKIKVDGGDKTVIVTKIYSRVHIKGLYNGMIKPPSLGDLDESRDSDLNMIISDSKLRGFFSPKMQLMSNQRRD